MTEHLPTVYDTPRGTPGGGRGVQCSCGWWAVVGSWGAGTRAPGHVVKLRTIAACRWAHRHHVAERHATAVPAR